MTAPGVTSALELTALRGGVAGQVLAPPDDGYDDARRIWNGAIDRHPEVIVRCAGYEDVVVALRCARDNGLTIAVRSGGHGVAGHAVCDGGLVVDLSGLRQISVDPEARQATAGAGVLWGELDAATQRFGLATVGGIVTHTGIAGLTLGGGIGWLMRAYGATADNLVAAELVTADGEHLRVSSDEHPDLFWGIRGAGANFGVVTSFTYRLHPVGPTVLAGPVYYSLADGRDVLRRYRDVIADAPDQLTTILNLRLAPALPFLPPEVHGTPIVMVGACWAGDDMEAGREALAPLRELATPIIDRIGPRRYTELQSMFDPTVPHGWHYHWKSVELPPLTDEAIDTLLERTAAVSSPRSYCIIFQLGGALGRPTAGDTAFMQREAAHNVNINAVWTPDDARGADHVNWCRGFFDALTPHARGRVYVNFLGAEGHDRVRAAYGPDAYARLRTLKRRWDPGNVFRLNQNIPPD